MRIIGIDPGVDGAMALWTRGKITTVLDLPVDNGEVDGRLLWTHLATLNAVDRIEMAFLEETHAMPKIGSQANYSQGLSRGIIVTAIRIANIPLTRVRPHVWKRNQGLNSDKGASLKLARELWPDHEDDFRLVKHHNRAEAALIARYGAYTLMHQENAS